MTEHTHAADTGHPIELTNEIEHALELLHGGHNLFLTGKAGTGKSTLIRHFLAETEHSALVAAPTGIAALNVGGYTIHRLFGFHPSHTVDHIRGNTYRPARFAQALSGVRTLILDEASMIRADVFDMIAEALDRFGPDPTMPFGGVQLVLVGDLFQLPPVVTEGEKPNFESAYATPYFFSANRYTRNEFATVDLTHVFRQSGDPELTSILNTIREGTLVGSARQRLNARTFPDFEPPDDEFWLTLTTTNRMADARNRRLLERLPGSELSFEAMTSGDLTGFELPTEEVLGFKVNAQVMMLNNDPAHRWVNGSIGRVIDVTLGRRGDRGERGPVVVVRFTNGEVAEVALHTWDVTRPVASGGGIRHEIVGTFTQLPLKLAWAITIHKSQGQTLDRLVVDLTGGTFATGQLYVALSRCRSLDGLILTRPVLAKDLRTDRRIIRFLRAPDQNTTDRRYCAIAALTVGKDNARSMPRPVELAIAFPDGTAVTTLVNPERDLAEARTDYGITVTDILLAPNLREAWAMIAPLLDGHTPVGVHVDSTVGHVDSELKRLGSAEPMPLGVEIPSDGLTPGERTRSRAGSALMRAQAALQAYERVWPEDPAAGVFAVDLGEGSGISYLLSRDVGLRPPTSSALPQLSAMLKISTELSAVLLDLPHCADQSGTDDNDDELTAGDLEVAVGARRLVAEQVRLAAERVPLTTEILGRLRRAGTVVGSDLSAGLETSQAVGAAKVLLPGTRVSFSGSALDRQGRLMERSDMEALAVENGLLPVANVTKTKCDALIVAEVGSQSGKARSASRWGKPVISVADFLEWAGH